MMAKWRATSLLAVLVLATGTRDGTASAQNFGAEHCAPSPDNVNVEPEADVVIGAILPIHYSGEGVYGCGQPSAEGVQVFEAMRWAVNVLNKNSGLISDSEPFGGSLIPGVKIGLKIYDSCGHQASAIDHLTSLFPVLRSGPTACDSDASNSTLTIGVVDMSDASSQPEVSEALRDYLIPSIGLSMMTLVPPERMAQVLLRASRDLNWTNVIVIHEDEEYSISVTKQLTQGATSGGGMCIGSIHTIPHFSGVKSNQEDLRPLRRILRTATGGLSEGTAIIVVTRGGDHAKGFLQIMAESPETVTKFQWLFSWIPPPTALSGLWNSLSSSRVYSMTPYPDKVLQFEEYWSALSSNAIFDNPDDRWYLEYLMSKKGCRTSGQLDIPYRNLPLCSNRNMTDTSLEVLLRTSRAVPALTSIFTLATAFHKAWEYKCQNRPEICPALRTMMRKEFVSQFLEPVEFLVGRDNNDVIEESRRRSPRNADNDKLEGSKLSLTQYSLEAKSGVNFKQLLVYDSEGSRILDHSFRSLPSQCTAAGCRGCVRPRQSRLEDSFQDLERDQNYLDISSEGEDIIIPLLLPLHQAGHSPLECGTAINPEAVQNLEAALWTVDKINEDRTFLSDARLGVVVLDTCSSPLLATQKLTAYITKPDLKATSSLAFISAASPEETLAANAVLRPLNISVVSTADIIVNDKTVGLDNHLFQVPAPAESQTQAALEVFDHIGWRYLTAVYEDNASYQRSVEHFLKAAKHRGICVGQKLSIRNQGITDYKVDKLLQALVDAKSQGSRVVVLWTGQEVMKKLLIGLGRFFEASVLSPGDFVLVSLGAWSEHLAVIHGLETEALGSIFFKQEQGDVPEFSTYFSHLLPNTNVRNPWFEELWQQEEIRHQLMNGLDRRNESSTLGSLEYIPLHSTTNMIQAMVSTVAGIATLRNSLCQVELGLCTEMSQQPNLQQLLSESILFTTSPRLDHPGEMFKFNRKGFGEIPIEVYNFRKGNGKTVNRYLKVGSYDGHLSKLASIVTYTSQGEIPIDSVPSNCLRNCFQCQSSSINHITVASSQDLYIAVTLGIHEPTGNPLTCGPLKPTRGFQNFEVILWALDKINSDPDILPGIELGLIVFDTCNSKEKAAMDISNFLTGTFKDLLPSPEHTVGFLADEMGDVVHPLVDLTLPLGITTLISSSVTPDLGDIKKYPHLLRMNLPNTVIVTSLVSILRYFHWNYVSIIHTADGIHPTISSQLFKEFKKQADDHNIELALIEQVAKDEDPITTMDIIAHRLKIKQNSGARVVVLLIPPNIIENLLSAVKRLQHIGRSHVGDFIWISYDSLESFQMYPEQSMGSLAVRSKSGKVKEFKEYFTNLNLKNNTRNPWLREYWEQVFNCRGSSCTSGLSDNLHQVGFIQDKSVPSTLDAFFALVHGLDNLRKQFCLGNQSEHCSAMRDHATIRERLFDHIKKVSFTSMDGKVVKFGENNYFERNLDIYNFRGIVGDVQAFVAVGQFDEANGLSINASRTRGYNNQGHQVTLLEIPSICNDSKTCQRPETRPLTVGPPFMKIPSNQEFMIGVMMPVHQPGDNLFTCSNVIEDGSLQNLLALSYALKLVNSNDTILPEMQLGALVFDHCGRRQKAEEQIFSFIASDGSLPYGEAGLKSRAMVAALTFDSLVADDLSPLFESMLIPQVSTPAKLVIKPGNEVRRSSRSVEQSHSNVEAKVIADILQRFDWKYVNVIHDGTESGRTLFWSFIEVAKSRKICIAQSLAIKPEMSVLEMIELMIDEMESDETRVVVLLLEEPTLLTKVIEAAIKATIVEDFIWIGLESKKDGRNIARTLQGVDIDFFLIRPETYEVPGFKEYYSSFSLGDHKPIPDSWFEEFWQHHFQCQLSHSTSPMRQYTNICKGTETLRIEPIKQDPFVYHTVVAVTTIASTLHDYLRRYCLHGDAATNLEDCGDDARQILWREIRKVMKGPPVHCVDGDCGPLKMTLGYQIFQLQKAKLHHIYQQVGLWKDDQLALRLGDVDFLSGVKVESICRQQCQKCFDQLTMDPEELTIPKPALYANFRTMGGIIVSALSLLGVLLVLICATYFLISFQVTIGTTVLGYMILFGLLLLYAINFAFILSPSEGTCGIRRFALGLSYAIIFSGMLVKVMNIWRMMGYHGNQFLGDSYHLTSPAALLVIAVGLVIIQVILSSAWLILIPPTTGILDGEWRCHPATTFEDELVISLVYVMLMLAITMLFSILTWKSVDNNKESQWIFTCCVLVTLVWFVWTVVSTQILHQYRDLTISVANLTCASVVMLCMYLRKVYIYNKLTRDQEHKSKIQQSALPVPNMYGTLSRTMPGIAPVTAYHSGTRMALSGKLYGMDRTAPSRMALIGHPSDDGTSDSGSGSVQVQATDLYPLDMYDGGSQFQPASLRLGGSSLVLDDTGSLART